MPEFTILEVTHTPQLDAYTVGQPTLTINIGVQSDWLKLITLVTHHADSNQIFYTIKLTANSDSAILNFLAVLPFNFLSSFDSSHVHTTSDSIQFTCSDNNAFYNLYNLLLAINTLMTIPNPLLTFILESMKSGEPRFEFLTKIIIDSIHNPIEAIRLTAQLLHINGPNLLPDIASIYLYEQQPEIAYMALLQTPSTHDDFSHAQFYMAVILLEHANHMPNSVRLINILQHTQHCGKPGQELLKAAINKLCIERPVHTARVLAPNHFSPTQLTGSPTTRTLFKPISNQLEPAPSSNETNSPPSKRANTIRMAAA